MKIQDFADMAEFEKIMSNWAGATGLATVAVGADGEYISDCYNFTDFCIKYTRGSEEGCRRCVKCDKEGKGVYHCHAGLIDFGIPLVVNGETVGSVIGGQVLPKEPDEEAFRKVAREIGVDEDQYIKALHKVPVKTETAIKASAELLGQVLNNYINSQYNEKYNFSMIDALSGGVEECKRLVESIQDKTKTLNQIQSRQNILALNASIEAARAGDIGKGFAVVAKEVGALSKTSKEINDDIEDTVKAIATAVSKMAGNKKF